MNICVENSKLANGFSRLLNHNLGVKIILFPLSDRN
jgi:hypothetical protein